MAAARHIAFVPLMNAGPAFADRLPNHFEFSTGAILERGRPDEVWSLLPWLSEAIEISPSEQMAWELAGGWIWMSSDEQPGPIESKNNCWAICGNLARSVEALCWFVDLCGGGENWHWRNNANMHNCGVYVVSADSRGQLTRRTPYIYSTPLDEYRDAPWSQMVLEHANAIEQAIAKLGARGVHPRVALANELRHAMCAYDVPRQRMRLQLCVSALETLLIAPNERHYIWDEPIRGRLRQVVDSPNLFTDAFFDQIEQRRNNAVHRGGLGRDGVAPQFLYAEMHVEIALREALCWAMMNSATIEPFLEKDEWPTNIPSLSW